MDALADPVVVSLRYGESVKCRVEHSASGSCSVQSVYGLRGSLSLSNARELERRFPGVAGTDTVIDEVYLDPMYYAHDMRTAQFAPVNHVWQERQEQVYKAFRGTEVECEVVAAFEDAAYARSLSPQFLMDDVELRIDLLPLQEHWGDKWSSLSLQPAAGDMLRGVPTRIHSWSHYQERVTVVLDVLATEFRQPRTLLRAPASPSAQKQSPTAPHRGVSTGSEKTLADCRRLLSAVMERTGRTITNALVLDDDRRVRESIAWLLTALGISPFQASCPEEADEALRTPASVQLALVDVHLTQSLHDTSGFPYATRLAGSNRGLVVFLLSGQDIADLLDQVRGSGVAGVLFKPTDPYGWVETICAALEVADGFEGKLLSSEPCVSEAGILDGARDDRLLQTDVALGGAQTVQPRSLQQELREVLLSCQRATGVDEICLFRIDPIGEMVDIVAAAVLSPDDRRHCQPTLSFSPIRDVVLNSRSRGQYLESDANANDAARKRNKHLLALLPYASCLGTHIEVNDGQGYACFAFSHEQGRFDAPEWTERVFAPHAAALKARLTLLLERANYERMMRVLHVLSGEGTYAKGLGHTLMQSLSVINMDFVRLHDQLDTLKQSPSAEKTEPVAKTVQEVEKQIAALGGLSKVFVRPMSGKGEAKPVNMDALLAEIMAGLSRLAASNKVVLRQVGARNLFPSFLTWEIPLRLVLTNLITNAVQMVGLFRPSGGLVECEVVDERQPSGQRTANLLISDNGPGIHRYLWSRVFMPMFTTRTDGLGMGLFLAREACLSIAARVDLQRSVLLAGSSFRLNLPGCPRPQEAYCATADCR